MNNEILRRKMMRDSARNMRRDSNYEDSRRDYNRDMHYAPVPQMYSHEYASSGRAYDNAAYNKFTPRGYDSRRTNSRYGDSAYSQPDYAQYGDSAMRDREYDGHYYYPFEVAGHYGKVPYPMHDYSSSPYLTERELEEWAERLLHSVDKEHRDMLNKEHIVKESETMDVHFDKYTKHEFYVTVLMMYTDFCKTLGKASISIYLRLAKDWLEDDDIAVKGSEKLAVYYDSIVEGM